jgi:hypothetical protein
VGGTEYFIGFEGSQALPVCPSGMCKLLTGTIEVYFFIFFYLFFERCNLTHRLPVGITRTA